MELALREAGSEGGISVEKGGMTIMSYDQRPPGGKKRRTLHGELSTRRDRDLRISWERRSCEYLRKEGVGEPCKESSTILSESLCYRMRKVVA